MNKLLCIALCVTAGAAVAHADYSQRPEARAMIERLSRDHGLEAQRLRDLLADARQQPSILEAMRRPAEKVLPWHRYRRIFLDEKRIAGGADFVRDHRETLERAESDYGVPAEIIAAIIGVETRYGSYIGRDRVLDALATLGFDYPERAQFFLGELEQFLILCHGGEGIDCDEVRGSYAGAMGWPQFIPSSYRAYAVDFDGDGKRNLWDSPADIIGSVASYLAEHGWRKGEAVALRAHGRAGDDIARSKRRTRYRYRELVAAGLEADAAPGAGTEVGLLELEGEQGPEFWIGLNNFFVITTYNHSQLYAMAVYQLSDAIARRLTREVAHQ